jgi:hypothetical protein
MSKTSEPWQLTLNGEVIVTGGTVTVEQVPLYCEGGKVIGERFTIVFEKSFPPDGE